MSVKQILEDVEKELVKAKNKFPYWPDDPLHASAIIAEEVGEFHKEVLQWTYEPDKTNYENIRKEAIQSIAMLIRFIDSLDKDDYYWKLSDQHKQK
jgi:NTP pyrophosphatase (non-canonical NTP hydrolase)